MLFLMKNPYVILGDPNNVAGPYELAGTILLFLQFIFTAMIVIGRRQKVKLISSFLAAVFGGLAFIVYCLNQSAVGNTLDWRVLFITAAGVVYGCGTGIWYIKKRKHMNELHKTTSAAAAETEEAARRKSAGKE